MVKQSFLLDPNAQSYTDDEIIAKINAAAAAISRANAIDGAALGGVDSDDIAEGTANKYDTGVPPADLDDLADGAARKAMLAAEKTKLGGIEAGAQVDQTGPEVRDLIVAIAEVDRKIVITDPQAGEYKILAIQRNADGKQRTEYDDVVEP